MATRPPPSRASSTEPSVTSSRPMSNRPSAGGGQARGLAEDGGTVATTRGRVSRSPASSSRPPSPWISASRASTASAAKSGAPAGPSRSPSITTERVKGSMRQAVGGHLQPGDAATRAEASAQSRSPAQRVRRTASVPATMASRKARKAEGEAALRHEGLDCPAGRPRRQAHAGGRPRYLVSDSRYRSMSPRSMRGRALGRSTSAGEPGRAATKPGTSPRSRATRSMALSSMSRVRATNPSKRALSQMVLMSRGVPRAWAWMDSMAEAVKGMRVRAGQPQPVLDVGLGVLGLERLEPVLERHPLRQRRIEAEVLLDLGQAEEDEGEELALRDLEVEQAAELLHQLPRGQHLRLVDEHHRLLPLLVDPHQPLVELREERQLLLGRRLDAELQGDAAEQPAGGDAGVDDDQQRRLVLLLREAVEHAPRQRGLAGADVAHQHRQPLHVGDGVGEPHQRLRVLRRAEVEARDRRVGEGLLVELVEVEVVHAGASLEESDVLFRARGGGPPGWRRRGRPGDLGWPQAARGDGAPAVAGHPGGAPRAPTCRRADGPARPPSAGDAGGGVAVAGLDPGHLLEAPEGLLALPERLEGQRPARSGGPWRSPWSGSRSAARGAAARRRRPGRPCDIRQSAIIERLSISFLRLLPRSAVSNSLTASSTSPISL